MSKNLYPKQLISFADQIALLKDRGMVVEDENKALHILQNVGYYRLCGYWYPLLKDKENHVFKPGATFDTAFAIYKFDSKLIITELEKIEVAVKTKIVSILSQQIFRIVGFAMMCHYKDLGWHIIGHLMEE